MKALYHRTAGSDRKSPTYHAQLIAIEPSCGGHWFLTERRIGGILEKLTKPLMTMSDAS